LQYLIVIVEQQINTIISQLFSNETAGFYVPAVWFSKGGIGPGMFYCFFNA
jgi:hypothetical protein